MQGRSVFLNCCEGKSSPYASARPMGDIRVVLARERPRLRSRGRARGLALPQGLAPDQPRRQLPRARLQRRVRGAARRMGRAIAAPPRPGRAARPLQSLRVAPARRHRLQRPGHDQAGVEAARTRLPEPAPAAPRPGRRVVQPLVRRRLPGVRSPRASGSASRTPAATGSARCTAAARSTGRATTASPSGCACTSVGARTPRTRVSPSPRRRGVRAVRAHLRAHPRHGSVA